MTLRGPQAGILAVGAKREELRLSKRGVEAQSCGKSVISEVVNPVNVVVLGGGPAGYVAALRAAQLGGRVTLIEQGALGGTCLNVGCIPTKSFLHSAALCEEVRQASRFGVAVEGVALDFAGVKAHRDQVVRRLKAGVAALLRKAGVEVVVGRGRLVDPRTVAVEGPQPREVRGEALIIATGSSAVDLPVARFDGETVLSSTEMLELEQVPRRLLVIGGGVIGCEFATIFRSFGSEVTIVEAEQQLLPREDGEAAGLVARELGKRGVKLLLATKLVGLDRTAQGVEAVVRRGDAEERLEADKVLVAVGRRPNSAGLGLAEVGVKTDGHAVAIDERGATSVPGIFAAGDVTGGPQLAHFAFHQGMGAAESALGVQTPTRSRAVPRCVYTFPEVAAVGLTEGEARERFGALKVGRFPFTANGRALAAGTTSGFVKVIAEARFEQVVGVVIAGPSATELIGEATLAVAQECTLTELAGCIHAHPTFAEAVHEAALAAAGRPLHGGA